MFQLLHLFFFWPLTGMFVAEDCNATENTKCKSCPEGFFTEHPNYLKKCIGCSSCGKSQTFTNSTCVNHLSLVLMFITLINYNLLSRITVLGKKVTDFFCLPFFFSMFHIQQMWLLDYKKEKNVNKIWRNFDSTSWQNCLIQLEGLNRLFKVTSVQTLTRPCQNFHLLLFCYGFSEVNFLVSFVASSATFSIQRATFAIHTTKWNFYAATKKKKEKRNEKKRNIWS